MFEDVIVWRADESIIRWWQKSAVVTDQLGTLDIDLEDTDPLQTAMFEDGLNRSAIQVAVHVGPFDE